MKWPDVALVFNQSFEKFKEDHPTIEIYPTFKEIMNEFDIPIFVNFDRSHLHANVKQNKLVALVDEGDVAEHIEIVPVPAAQLLLPTSEDDFYAGKDQKTNRLFKLKGQGRKKNVRRYALEDISAASISLGKKRKKGKNREFDLSSRAPEGSHIPSENDSEEEIQIAPRGTSSQEAILLSGPTLQSSNSARLQQGRTYYQLLDEFLVDSELLQYLNIRRDELLLDDEQIWSEQNIRDNRWLSDLAVTANIMAKLQPMVDPPNGKKVRRSLPVNPSIITVLPDRTAAGFIFPNYAATMFALGYRSLFKLEYSKGTMRNRNMMCNIRMTAKLKDAIFEPIERCIDLPGIINGPSLPEAVINIWKNIFREFSDNAQNVLCQ